MKRPLPTLLALSILSWTNSQAAVSEADITELREQISRLSIRLDALAAENAKLRASQSASNTGTGASRIDTEAAPESRAERIGLSGDFRYRYETIAEQGSPTRERNRIRARVNLKANAGKNVEIGFGLATGSDDPVSANQTLGDGGSSKNAVVNLAYADWTIADGLRLVGGKFRNPLVRPGGQELLWDSDWTPEGLALRYQREQFFFNAIGTYLESDTRKDNHSFAWGTQLGMTAALGETEMRGGIAYYSFATAGLAATFGDPADPGDYFGNTAIEAGGLACGSMPAADCRYRFDYRLTEIFAEASFQLGNWPATVFFDHVQNGDATGDDTAWTIGARLGRANDAGQFDFSYLYAEKEKDAVFGLLTNSDFAGGGTDNKGHLFKVNYGVSSNWTIGATYFANKTDLSSGSNNDYNRLMIDTQWKWK